MTTPASPDPSAAVTSPGRMQALVQERYGTPEVLSLGAVEVPSPGRREVLVEVGAASVHPGDYFVMTGRPRLVRLAFGLRRPRRRSPGMDLAGIVRAVGAEVTSVHVGDRVFGWTTTGALAEYATVREDHLAPVPAGVSAADAAAVPTSGMTALQALRDVARLTAGQTVLITGASGGVGSFAVQIAKALGAEVTAVCSGRNAELVRRLGADHVIDYETTDVTDGSTRFDVILDSVEAQPLAAMRRILTPTGTLIPNSGRGGAWIGPLGRIARARLLSALTRQRLRPFTSLGRRDDLVALAEMLASGEITPVVDRSYALTDAADALRRVATGHTRGKLVVIP